MSFRVNPLSVYIIIPFFNENLVIEEVIKSLLLHSYKIILVDDGSPNSPRLISSLADKNIYHIRHKVNLGQGAALQTGISFALQFRPTYIITFDADGQHTAEDIPKLLEPLVNKSADIVFGSRFLKQAHHNAGFIKKGMLKAGRFVNYFFTGLLLSDAHNGLRAMTSSAAAKIHLRENRMAHASEFLLQIRKQKLQIVEVPVRVRYTEYSRKKGQSIFNSIRIFFDLVLHKLFE
jgi:glycosyltransferase involved in cell wall biosynthesis